METSSDDDGYLSSGGDAIAARKRLLARDNAWKKGSIPSSSAFVDDEPGERERGVEQDSRSLIASYSLLGYPLPIGHNARGRPRSKCS